MVYTHVTDEFENHMPTFIYFRSPIAGSSQTKSEAKDETRMSNDTADCVFEIINSFPIVSKIALKFLYLENIKHVQ